MTLSLHLKIVGASLLLLAVAHAFFPRRFGWAEELSRLSPLNRQMFQVHCFFIGLVLFMFGLLSLCFTIPRQLGMFEAIRNRNDHELWQPLGMLAVSLLLLLGPFYLVGWFLRACSHFAAHRIPNGPAASDA